MTIRYTTDLLKWHCLSCCGIDSNTVYILLPFAIGQSRAVNTNVPYLDHKNSDFGLGDRFLVFSMTSAWIIREIKRKARLKYAACKVNTVERSGLSNDPCSHIFCYFFTINNIIQAPLENEIRRMNNLKTYAGQQLFNDAGVANLVLLIQQRHCRKHNGPCIICPFLCPHAFTSHEI